MQSPVAGLLLHRRLILPLTSFGTCQQSLASIGLQMPYSDLCCLLHMALSASPPQTASLCVSKALFAFLFSLCWSQRCHYNQFYLWRLFPKLGLIPRSCMDLSLGTHSCKDNVTVLVCSPAWPPKLSELLVPVCEGLMTV